MIKIWISYFYQVRNFTPNMIPFSTAKWDPKWFHKFEGQDKVFVDERGVINGFRLNELVFNKDSWNYLVELGQECIKDCPLQAKVERQLKENEISKDWSTFGCRFMDTYFKQLWETVDFDNLISSLEKIKKNYEKNANLDDEAEIVLLVHEAPSIPCAERYVLKRWFAEFGYNLEEWNKYE